MTTLGAVLRELGAPLTIEELDVPAPVPGQVLVELAYSGVCHTQLSEVTGRKGPDRFLPHTLGHEGAGTVVAVGAGVTKVVAGDRVVATWIKASGADVTGAKYGSSSGPVNSGAISTFLRHALISENRLVKIPAAMPLREAALLGCAVPTGAGIVRNTLKIGAGESLAVFGAGGIGMCAIMAAHAAGAGPIIAIDVQAERLAKALALGATHTIDARTENVIDAVRAATGGAGTHYAVESAGRKDTMEAALGAVRNGGTAVLAGNLGAGETISIDPFELIRGKKLLGTWGGESAPDADVPHYVEHFLAGRMPVDQLIFREYALSEINVALDDLTGTIVGRGIIRLAA
jgi:S-(hydroxymethyl)glutathione dehydrogenase/alcohol dehydrogenase